jgi:DHA2 family multidrug resistance protein-like MFS transporter
MIDVSLFASVRFSTAATAVLASNIALAAPLLLLTQQLQIAQGLDPLPAGLAFLPIAVGAVIAGPLTPKVVRALGMNGAVGGGFSLVAVGLLVFSFVTVESPYVLLLTGMVLLGAGVSVASAAASAALLAAAPASRSGNAAAIQETAYELGLTMGVSIFGSFALAAYRSGLELPAGVDPEVVSVIESGLPQAAAVLADQPDLLSRAIDAFSDSFADTMLLAAGAALVLAVIATIALPRDRESRAVSEH